MLFGLALSIPILFLGAELAARVLGRFPQLVYVGCVVLIHTAVTRILEDPIVHSRFATSTLVATLLSVVLSAIIIGASLRVRRTAQPTAA